MIVNMGVMMLAVGLMFMSFVRREPYEIKLGGVKSFSKSAREIELEDLMFTSPENFNLRCREFGFTQREI